VNAVLQAWREAPVTVVLAVTGLVPLVRLAARRRTAVSAPGIEPPEVGFALAVGLFVAYIGVGGAMLRGSASTRAMALGVAAAAVVASVLLLRRLERPRGGGGDRLRTAFLIGWAALPVVYGLLVAVVWWFPDVPIQEAVRVIREREPGWRELAVQAVLVAPLFEELVFRGFLQGALRSSSGPRVAGVVSAAAFAVIHEPLAMLPMLAFGWALALVRDRTGSVAPCIAVHVAFNALTVGQLVFL